MELPVLPTFKAGNCEFGPLLMVKLGHVLPATLRVASLDIVHEPRFNPFRNPEVLEDKLAFLSRHKAVLDRCFFSCPGFTGGYLVRWFYSKFPSEIFFFFIA